MLFRSEGIYRYFASVVDAVADSRLRVYLYHIPPVSQVPISLGLIERLLKAYPGTIAGVKDSSGNWDNTAAMLRQFQPHGFDVFTGGKPLVKRQKSLPPTKYNNALLAEMIAVKFNIAASALEKTPLGFGELGGAAQHTVARVEFHRRFRRRARSDGAPDQTGGLRVVVAQAAPGVPAEVELSQAGVVELRSGDRKSTRLNSSHT